MKPMNTAESWKAFAREPTEATFGPLYESTKRLIWTLCMRLLRHHDDASDAFQSAYCRILALARDPVLSGQVEDPSGTLCRLAIREADALRKRRARRAAREALLDEDATVKGNLPMPDEAAARSEVRERVEALVDELPERYRLPVQLHFFHGLTQREVAKALGEPLATVAGRIQSALGKLDPAFRRAGLRGAGTALAGIALGGALLEPSLAAGAVFARAEASAGAVAGASVSTTLIVTGGLLAVKAKVAAIALLVALALAGALFHREIAGLIRPAGRATVAVAPAPETATDVAPVPEPVEEKKPAAAEAAPVAEAAGGTVKGLVTDSVTGEPIPGAVVRSKDMQHWQDKERMRESSADDQGAYVLTGLGEGVHELIASADGRADRKLEVKMDVAGEAIQDIALDPGMSVLVTVVGEDGQPIAGARAVPSNPDMDGGFYLDMGVDTDESGKAWLHKLNRLRPPQIGVYKDGYRTPYGRPQAGPGEESAEIKLVLERIKMKARAIAGSIKDASGRPLEGIKVEWKDGQGTAFGDGIVYGQHSAVTGRDGRYRLDYEDDYDSCDLGVAAPGWAPQVARGVRPGTPGEPAVKDFTLEPGHWLAGRVLDEESRPLAGARIHAMPMRDLLNPAVAYPAVLRATKTDEEGRFRLEDLPGPSAALEIRAADRRPSKEIDVEVDREVDLVLEGYGVVRGRVTDAVTGEPVQVFTVRRNLDLPGLSFTAPDGRFVLEGLPRTGGTKVAVDAAGYISLELEDVKPGADGQAEETTFALHRGLPLEGVMVDAATGAPLAGVQILATAREYAKDFIAMDWDAFRHLRDVEKVVTGDDGAFRILEQKEKPVSVLVRAPGRQRLYIAPADRAAFALPDGRLRIPLERGERLRGICYQDGRPAQATDIHLWLEGPEPPREGQRLPGEAFARTDADGKFAWDHLAPGTYIVEVTRKVPVPARELEVKVRRRVVVEPGVEATVELGKEVGASTLIGRLTGMEGRESVWAQLILRPLDGGDELFLKTYRDWDWRFVFPFLRPGKHSVEVQFYTKEGTGSVTLPTIEVTGDGEQDIEVPAE